MSNQKFKSFLSNLAARNGQVAARVYGADGWSQFSGRDIMAHIGRSEQYWLNQSWHKPGFTVVFMCRNTYSAFVAGIAAALSGMHVLYVRPDMGAFDLKQAIDQFQAVAVVTDVVETKSKGALSQAITDLKLPVTSISAAHWVSEDTHPMPRICRNIQGNVGCFQFVSFGNDGAQHPCTLSMDALLLVAQNFILHVGVPTSIHWQSMEVVSLSSVFGMLSKFTTLLKNGILGFANVHSDWITNFHILRPTLLFVGPVECGWLAAHIDDVSKQHSLTWNKTLEKVQSFMGTGRAMKLGKRVFENIGLLLRKADRFSLRKDSIEQAIAGLEFVVHGYAAAQPSHVVSLSKFGVPVIETFGVTAACGLLSSNTFDAPHLNMIGSPLPHVSFRLGAESMLQYRISNDLFPVGWTDSGDIAQMTPFGFMITGRKKHLFRSQNGVMVSPARLEALFLGQPEVEDICLAGDKMPYLVAIIFPSSEIREMLRTEPEIAKQKMDAVVTSVNESLPRHATIKKYRLTEKPFLESNGERLSTGSLNRLHAYDTRKDVIADLYRD